MRITSRWIQMRAVREDTRQCWDIPATGAVISLQPVLTKQFGRAHESGHRVALRINRADATIGDSSQGKFRDVPRNRAVAVVLSNDDVGRLLPSEFAELVHNAA